jgi:hypothetical protein
MKIANLTETTSLAASDNFPVSSTANGTRRVTLTTLAAAVLATADAVNGMETQYSTPATGASVAVAPTVSGASSWLLVTPVVTLADLTLVLPGDGSTGGATAADGQEVLVNTTQELTALVVSSVGKSVIGGPTTLAQFGFFRMRYNAVNNSWYRVG